jgi:hypothetical protein
LFELNALISRQRFIGHLHGIGLVEAGAEHHGQTGDRARDSFDLFLEASARATFAIRQVPEIRIGAF